MISNAKDIPLSQSSSGLPDVGAAIMEILQPVVAVVMEKQQIDGYTQEIPVRINTKASIQPFSAQQLKMLPEGQRGWRYFAIYILSDVDLKPDEVFWINHNGYRIMAKYDWNRFGYFQYECVEDYNNAPNVADSD